MANDPTQSETRLLIQGQIFLVMLLLALTIVISWRLMVGSIAPAQGFLWMGIFGLCPIVWYCIGYFTSKEKKESIALLISALGWVFVSMGFLVHYNVLRDIAPGTPASEVSDPLITIFLLIGLLLLVGGGFLSWQAATNSQLVDTISSQ